MTHTMRIPTASAGTGPLGGDMKMLILIMLIILGFALLGCVSPSLSETKEIVSLRQENGALKVQLAEVGGMLQILPKTHALELELATRKGFEAGVKASAQIEMR